MFHKNFQYFNFFVNLSVGRSFCYALASMGKKVKKWSEGIRARWKNDRQGFLVWALTFLVIVQLLGNFRLAQTVSSSGQLNQVSAFGNDLNEIRQFLLLPTKEYDFSSSNEAAQESVEEQDPIVSVFAGLEKLALQKEKEALYAKNKEQLDAYFNAQETLDYFAGHQLTVQDGVVHHLVDENGFPLITVELQEDGIIRMSTFQETKTLDRPTDVDAFKVQLKDVVEKKLKDLKKALAALNAQRDNLKQWLLNADLQAALSAHSLSVSPEQMKEGHYEYQILSREGAALAGIKLYKKERKLTWDDEMLPFDEAGFVQKSMLLIQNYDGRNTALKEMDALRAHIQSLEEDKGFQALLKKHGLTFVFAPNETETDIEYTIQYTASQEILAILYIHKETGELMLKTPTTDGVPLNTFLAGQKKNLVASLPEQVSVHDGVIESEDQLNILLAGKHGSNVDTMIFAHIDISKQIIKLVSIPRDLYHENRKINSVYADFGMDELLRRISDISGYKVTKYILVDMYVFKDLIDQIGGVDVTLETDLIDPTYKTVENGKIGTLYYAAGTYHLNGTEALRIARSRHTTSDYDRAARQQLILEALQAKARNLGFGDAQTVLKLIKTVLEKTETNIAFDDAMRSYFRYQGFNVDRGYVLSSANVLQSEKVPVNYVTSLQVPHCDALGQNCTKQYAIYTLEPRDGNWDYIKWYFRQTFEAE
ncbi:MAG: Cell envelope-related transcriptional attenuator [Candidatus Peregrinibacteria bacterium GW2011_GWA2_44_7]|nr:MAG: Cell envelope-related transcriptional attenuator [Candidatus Peregrinibacteria bacterium GW2011_GWA2_44_7]